MGLPQLLAQPAATELTIWQSEDAKSLHVTIVEG